MLADREIERAAASAALQKHVWAELGSHLSAVLPGFPVLVFGSLAKPGAFHAGSDIDLGIEKEPPGTTLYRLTAELSDRMGLPVDIVVLETCRFAAKIRKEGIPWTP